MSTLVTSATSPLRTEADIVNALQRGVYTITDLYELVADNADVARDNGLDVVAGATDCRWRRRVRGALTNLRERGVAHRLQRSVWMIDRPAARPKRLLFVSMHGSIADIELRVADAVTLLRELDEPADLVFCDPPYGLDRGGPSDRQNHVYQRGADNVISGYVDVPDSIYDEFANRWVAAAAAALRPGGQLAVVTGPQRAAVHQVAAERAGLSWVQTIAAKREFALYMTRRCSPAHWVITVMCQGASTSSQRTFHAPPDLPLSDAGNAYPTDFWLTNGRSDRHGVVRYDNSLPLTLAQRVILMLTDPGHLVADGFAGSGTTAIACWATARRCVAGDINPHAIRFAAARLLTEHAWPLDRAPTLFNPTEAAC